MQVVGFCQWLTQYLTFPVMVAWPGLVASTSPVSSVTVAMPELEMENLIAASSMGPPLLWICREKGRRGGREGGITQVLERAQIIKLVTSYISGWTLEELKNELHTCTCFNER